MLPTLENAQPTLHNLHTVAMILGAVRLMVFPRQPNYLELGMKVKPEGLSTDVLPSGGEVTLDFRLLALVYQPAQGAATTLSINGKTQAALLETLLETIYANELSSVMPHSAGESYTDAMFTQKLVPEASASVQDLYGQLFPVVQAVITDKNANIDKLLATANAAGQAKLG